MNIFLLGWKVLEHIAVDKTTTGVQRTTSGRVSADHNCALLDIAEARDGPTQQSSVPSSEGLDQNV